MNIDAINIERARDSFEREFYFKPLESDWLECAICGCEFEDEGNHFYDENDEIICENCHNEILEELDRMATLKEESRQEKELEGKFEMTRKYGSEIHLI